MCQFPQLECILTNENFALRGGGGGVPPVSPVPTPMGSTIFLLLFMTVAYCQDVA